jgi:SOS-response transcriptional repressor LexA
MDHDVFIQPVHAEVELDRRLRCGDSLIVESRDALRDGEIFVAESDVGACVGRWALTGDLMLYPLESVGLPARVHREDLRVRGVVIGVKSPL